MLLDVDDGAVGAGDDRLAGGAGEPVDHRAAHDEAEDDLGLHDGEGGDDLLERAGDAGRHLDLKHLLQEHDDAEHHRRGADDRGADEHGLGGGLEGVAGAVALLELVLGVLEVGLEAEILLNLGGDAGAALDLGELIDGLRVVGDRAVAVDRDGHRAHAQEAEGHEAEREDRRGEQELGRHEGEQGGVLREVVGRGHQEHDDQAHPERGEVARDQARQDVQRGAAVAGAVRDFLHVAGVRADEDLGELRDQRAGDGAAADDDREDPPEGRVDAGLVGEQEVRGEERDADGHDRRDPDEVRQRGLEIKVLQAAVLRLGDDLVDEVGGERGDDHQRAHREEPDDEHGAELVALGEGEGEEGDQRDAGHAVGLEAVGGRPDGVAGVVTGAVRDDARVLGVVLGQLEHDLHQVGADVGDLGENAAADAEDRGAEGLADGEADEAGADQLPGQEHQDADHEEQLHADQQEADAHAGAQRDEERVERVALERGERGAGVGDGVDADAEPGDAVRAEDAEDGGQQDHRDMERGIAAEEAEVVHHAGADQHPEDREELALREQVGLAGLPDHVGNAGHRGVHLQRLRLRVLHDAEDRADRADQDAQVHQRHATQPAQAVKVNVSEIGDLDVGFARAQRREYGSRQQGGTHEVETAEFHCG